MQTQTAPLPHEIELSLFGRGYGESSLLHLGSGLWVMVDSLKDRDGHAVALAYLQSISVHAPDAIRLIIATHWHDDHVRGLSDVYSVCPNVAIAFPIAMKKDEWSAFQQGVRGGGSERFSSGVAELERIAQLQTKLCRRDAQWVVAHKVLLREEGQRLAHGCDVSIEALAPTDADVAAFLALLGANRIESDTLTRVEPFERNDVSIAAWVRIGEHRILLGADLEVISGSTSRGWDAIVRSPARLDGRASAYKVAHHGSANAHHPTIWSSHLVEEPFAIMAPWNKGRGLPTTADVQRLVGLTPNGYATGRSKRKPRTRDSAVERTIRENAYKLHALGDVGQVRLRMDPRDAGAHWRVELFGGALALHELVEAT